MLKLNNDIGLIVWGSKEGVEDFFWSPNINLENPEIRTAIDRDIRSIISMPTVDVTFYSLKSISGSKVYTCYKTIRDATKRRYSFLAISIYVPNQISFKYGVLGLLNRLMSIYVSNYLDFNLVIKHGVNEDEELFFQAINETPVLKITGQPNEQEYNFERELAAYLLYSDFNNLNYILENINQYEYQKYQLIFFFPNKRDGLQFSMPLLPFKHQLIGQNPKIESKSIATPDILIQSQIEIISKTQENLIQKTDNKLPHLPIPQNNTPNNNNNVKQKDEPFFRASNFIYVGIFFGLILITIGYHFINETIGNNHDKKIEELNEKKTEIQDSLESKMVLVKNNLSKINTSISIIENSSTNPNDSMLIAQEIEPLKTEFNQSQIRHNEFKKSIESRLNNLNILTNSLDDSLTIIANSVKSMHSKFKGLTIGLEGKVNAKISRITGSLANAKIERDAELKRNREQQRIRRQARAAIGQLNLFSRGEKHINLDKIQEEIDKINSSGHTHFEDNEKAIILERLKELNEIHRASYTFRTTDKALIESLNAKKILIHYKNHGKHITNGQKKYIDKVIKGEVVGN